MVLLHVRFRVFRRVTVDGLDQHGGQRTLFLALVFHGVFGVVAQCFGRQYKITNFPTSIHPSTFGEKTSPNRGQRSSG